VQIRTDIHETYALVSVRGNLVDEDLIALGKSLETIQRHGYVNLVLNLDGVPAMSPTGLKNLLEHWGRVRFNQGGMKIVAKGPVKNLFRAMGVDELFESCETVVEAVSKLLSPHAVKSALPQGAER
jgi:anti-anti-sigma factor